MTAGTNKFQAEINVTPLVDVVLVLLIIFMVIMPLTLRGHDVSIPGAAAATPSESSYEQVVLTVDMDSCPVLAPPEGNSLPANCTVHLNDEELVVTELAPRVVGLFSSRPTDKRVIFLAADDRLNYEGVMRIVDKAKSQVAGMRIGIVSRTASL